MQAQESASNLELPLRQQMLLVFSLVMLVFSVGLALTVDRNLRTSALETAAQQSSQDAMFFANLLDNDMEQELIAIRSHADNMEELGLTQDFRTLGRALDNLKRSKASYAWIGYADLQGNVLAASEGMLRGANVSERAWFQTGLKHPATIDVHEAKLLPGNSQPLRFVDVVAPVKNREDIVIGVLGAHLSVDWLSQQMGFYAKSLLKDHGYKPSVIGPDGQVRFGHEQDPTLVEQLRKQQAKSNAEVQWFVHRSVQEGEQLVAFAKHRGSAMADNIGWTTLITIPKALIDERVRATRLLAVTGIALAGLVAWFTLWWLLRIAGQPVRVLMREIRKSRDTHQPLALHPGLPQEFVDITRSINEFLLSIQSRELLLEQAFNEMRDSFTGVTDSFPGVLFRVEEASEDQFVFSYLSPSAQNYLALDMLVMPISTEQFYARVDADVRDEMKKRLRLQAFQQKDIDIIMPVTGRDDKKRQLRIRGRIKSSQKGRRAWDGVIVDVSDLIKAQQQAAEADNAKSKFLATMSHEIRTPLNGILGFAQILLQEVQTEQQKSDVRKIIDTSETLTHILNDILDFSKIEEGKLQLENRPFNLSELIESSAALFHEEARKRQIEFTVDLSIGHSHQLLGDPTRLRQILTNLLSNALKFTPVGSVRLLVHIDRPVNELSRLHITVIDTGIGMTAEQQQRLFQRFEQSDNSIFRRFGGSGLGLAIAKGLLDAMGGSIRVQSMPQAGTNFDVEIELPILRLPEAPPAEAPATVAPSLRILVADDVPMNRELICRLLRKEGHHVSEAEDGLQATELAQTMAFDLILMDIDMPVCDGLQATRNIRSGSGLSRKACIIALTGYAFEKDIANALDCGMNMHLAKPINFKKLRAMMTVVTPVSG